MQHWNKRTRAQASRSWAHPLKRASRIVVLAALAIGIAIPGALAPDSSHAAGNGVLDISLTPVNYATGDTITETAYGQNGDRVAYRVAYACSVDACNDATVTFSPSQADPYGLANQGHASETNAMSQGTRPQMLAYESWVRPATAPNVEPGGTNSTGKVFQLGDLAAGDSGTFLVIYYIQPSGTYTTARPAQFYPDGFQIEMNAEISSETAVAPVSASSSPVTWHIDVPEPSVLPVVPADTQPDTPVTVQARMSSGAFPSTGSTRIEGLSQWQAAGNFTVTLRLPAEAALNGAIPHGGVYDATSHSIVWTYGTEANPEHYAAGGWGHIGSQWASRNTYAPRNVPVTFPASNFAGADSNGCNFEDTVEFEMETSVTYLDTARTTKHASGSTSMRVACWDPFGSGAISKASTGDGNDGQVTLVDVPELGDGPSEEYWEVNVYNRSNQVGRVVAEDTFDQADLPVFSLRTNRVVTYEWQLDTGASGTTTATSVDAPAGTRFVWTRVTIDDLAPSRVRPSDTGQTRVALQFRYWVLNSAVIGEERTNAASMTIDWPTAPDLAPISYDSSRTVRFKSPALPTPQIRAAVPTAVVTGGGQPVPGSEVTYTLGGDVRDVPSEIDAFAPEYVFIAPVGWKIAENSIAFVDPVSPGVEYQYLTKVIDGVERDVAVAIWSADTKFPLQSVTGQYEQLPKMTVVASPTFAVAAGTNSQAEFWLGDSARNWPHGTGADQANYVIPKQNIGDIDESGDTDAWFSTSTHAITVLATDSLGVTKEICRPDADALDGCAWVIDQTNPVPVPTTSTSIKYRISLQNLGNTTLSDVVAYDVLPHIGDVGLIPATENTQRGSQFAQSLVQVENVSPGLLMTYSPSTNPARPEVNPGAGGTSDWSTTVAGQVAIRAAVDGDLDPGELLSFEYTAAVDGAAATGDIACNSVAIASDRTLASEPTPVCAQTVDRASILIEKVGQGPAGVVPLDGAEFELRIDDSGQPGNLVSSEYQPQATGAEGMFLIDDLVSGTYWLIETQAPIGYSLLAEPVKFTLADVTGAVTLDGATAGALVTVTNDPVDGATIRVEDATPFALPLSGGYGELPYYLLGGVLAAAAGVRVWFVYRQKQEA